MPQVEQVRKRGLKPAVWAAGGIGLAGMIVGGVLLLGARPQAPKQDTAAVINKAADKLFSGDRQTAIGLLNDQLKQAKSDEDRVVLYMNLGSAYEGKPDNAMALVMYLKADEIRPGYGINEAVGRAAEATGDKGKALDYYRRNRKLIQDGKAPQHAEELAGVEEAIVRLGGKL